MLDEKEWEKSLDDTDSKITGLTAAASPSLVDKKAVEVKTLDDRTTAADRMSDRSLISSAAADSPYNQENATIESVAEEAKKGWLQEMYLYLV